MSDDAPTSTLYQAVTDRLSHPVIGILTLSFIAINWKPVFYLFSSDSKTAPRIEEALAYTDYWTLLIWPFGATALYVLLSPLLKRLAVIWDLRIQRKTDGLLEDYDIEQRRKLVARLHGQATDLSMHLDSVRVEIEDANANLARIKDDHVSWEQRIDQLLKFETYIAEHLSDLNGNPSSRSRNAAVNLLETRFAIVDELRRDLTKRGYLPPRQAPVPNSLPPSSAAAVLPAAPLHKMTPPR